MHEAPKHTQRTHADYYNQLKTRLCFSALKINICLMQSSTGNIATNKNYALKLNYYHHKHNTNAFSANNEFI